MFECKQCGKDHNLICENPETRKWEENKFCEKCMFGTDVCGEDLINSDLNESCKEYMDKIHENMLKEQREEDDN